MILSYTFSQASCTEMTEFSLVSLHFLTLSVTFAVKLISFLLHSLNKGATKGYIP